MSSADDQPSGRSIDPRLEGDVDNIYRETLDIINERGVRLVAVGGGDDPVKNPLIVYTVGLHLKGHPELVTAGLAPGTVGGVLMDLADRVLAGETLADPITDALADDYTLRLVEIPPADAHDLLIIARRHRGEHGDGQDVQALQVVLPDTANLFPWQDGCDPEYVRLQRIYGTPTP